MAIDPASLELKNLHRAILVGVYSHSQQKALCNDYLSELERLCETYGWQVAARFACMLRKVDAATYLSKGKVEELVQMVIDLNADVVVFDDEISPHQQRNLEKLLKKAVIDRTELIIEVFAQRAQTREARLQIELAKARYQMPRLKRLWTHLSRQSAGGGAYLKGEGEKQIEIDRRILRRQIDSLKQEIEQVAKQRHTQRGLRIRTEIPTFAIVGYTNVGKSTLLRALTQADVLVEDKLFATLDTTTRKFILPNKQAILLIDTVGFIRKIPHTLVAAFRSTLEEAIHTDILLHLIDVSHPMAFSQAEETLAVLKELGAEDKPIITVLNKIDLCPNHSMLAKFRILYQKTVPICAETGEGFEILFDSMMREIALLRKTVRVKIPQSHYALVSELMRLGRVLECEYEENDVVMKLEIPTSLEHRLQPFLLD
ncbi:GTPase HflX [Candidatus Rhabdochlamydia sp. T3358]|uniref:GTPase HflX n=1 Tax=Candidatus Rhabdochlamydia sp. T3358 TaxID=2099795 RepID=UPI0010B5139A|nr:GTPase HflX [Candidatus Rhabdochlamydia sp. T3358]VHO02402.1 GTPase HflX [Candidatus Rhabdochlamydia sp. T3358]